LNSFTPKPTSPKEQSTFQTNIYIFAAQVVLYS
jgi:hypothetical protein